MSLTTQIQHIHKALLVLLLISVSNLSAESLTKNQAARFLTQATLGSTNQQVDHLVNIGIDRWLQDQFKQPPGLTLELTGKAITVLGEEENEDLIGIYPFLYRRYAMSQQIMTSKDVLRQRIAFALSEILVVSDRAEDISDNPLSMAAYWDLLLNNAFGNYADLLLQVSLHPAMGMYLSHINNKKANPEVGRFPDENYAREVMQLFSIGLFELNKNGSRKKDSEGNDIASYSNREITEMAKIFTGLRSAANDEEEDDEEFKFDPYSVNYLEPMRMIQSDHDLSEKHLLHGFIIAANQSGKLDISQTIFHLVSHPNTAPFISRRLIQRLVTSNPTPDYIARVASVFSNNGHGVIGDLKAVITAILTDSEARLEPTNPNEFGRMQEPWIRYISYLRTLAVSSDDGLFLNLGEYEEYALKQFPLTSPSVFNFFTPDYKPNGILADKGLNAPEFQITTSSTVISYANFMKDLFIEDSVMEIPTGFAPVQMDLRIAYDLALSNPKELLNIISTLFVQGQLSLETQDIILDAILPISDAETRIKLALYLVSISPDFVIAN